MLNAIWGFRSLAVILLMLTFHPVWAGQAGSIPVKLIDGALVAFVDMKAGDQVEEFAIAIDVEGDHKLSLLENAWKRLGSPNGDQKIGLQFSTGYTLEVNSGEVTGYGGPLDLNDITKRHIAELTERKLAGSLGFKFFQDYKVTIDLSTGELWLDAPASGDTPLAAIEGDVVTKISSKESQTYIPVLLAGSVKTEMIFGSSFHDTYLDSSWARDMGAPAGDIEHARIAGEINRADIDLADYVAFRTTPFFDESEERGTTALISGTNFLRHFKVEFDWKAGYGAFTKIKSADYPKDDLAFFRALDTQSPDMLRQFLETYPGARLYQEAAEAYWQICASAGVSSAQLYKAAKYKIESVDVKRRTEKGQELLAEMMQAQYDSELLYKIGDLSLSYSRDALDGFSAYGVHVLLGLIAEQAGDLTKAWEHLLSASFGQPYDLRAIVALGRVYEAQGRYARAYSRYRKVATYVPAESAKDEFLPMHIVKKCMAEAREGMERVKNKVPAKYL